VAKPSEIVQLLLNDEQLANIDNTNGSGLPPKKSGKRPGAGSASANNDTVRDLWNDEGDDFFGHLANQGNVTADKGEEDGTVATPSRGKKRKGGGSSRPRKTGGKVAGKRKAEGANDVGSGMDVQVE
jgi:DNA helicase INO80